MKKTKQIIVLLLSIIMIFSLVGCGQKQKDATGEKIFNSGKYTAVAQGMNGDVNITVEFTEDEIKSIVIGEHSETPGIFETPVERIPDEIIKGQTLNVDTVAGATMTSEAILSAVEDCIKQAGGDPEVFRTKEAVKVETQNEIVEKKADVVIIGTGAAGYAAAATATENGASVIMIEKMPAVGGNTITSGGEMNAVDPERQEPYGIVDSIDKHFEDTMKGGDDLANPTLVRVLVDGALDVVHWLESYGVKFAEKCGAPIGSTGTRGHTTLSEDGASARYYIEPLNDYVTGENTEIMLETKAEEFIVEDGRVIGVKAVGTDGKTYNIFANNGVVLATGGFGANLEMVNEVNPIIPIEVGTSNVPGATGDGLVMAEKIGANLIDLEWIQMVPGSGIDVKIDDCIFVNMNGERFIQEDGRRDQISWAILEQPNQAAFAIYDANTVTGPEYRNAWGQSIYEECEEGRMFMGDTIEELAEKIGIDPVVLEKTINNYNENIGTSKDEVGRKIAGVQLTKTPYFAGPMGVRVHHTMGGVQINENAEVLDQSGSTIKGLYAAGEVTGGIHGTNRLGANAITDCFVFGRIAGKNAALNK